MRKRPQEQRKLLIPQKSWGVFVIVLEVLDHQCQLGEY
mgnify:CR=1 FL=1